MLVPEESKGLLEIEVLKEKSVLKESEDPKGIKGLKAFREK